MYSTDSSRMMFTARYRNQVTSILLHKEMKVPEFIDALSFALQLPEGGQIVGFQDRNGLIITPSYVCLNSQELRNETYDVLIKNSVAAAQQPNHSALLFSGASAGNNSGLLLMDHPITPNQQPVSHNPIQQPAQSFGVTQTSAQTFGQNRSGLNNQGFTQNTNVNNDRTLLMGGGHLYDNGSIFANNNAASGPQQLGFSQEEEIISFVQNLQVDPLLTESVKSKIISKVRQRDSGIMGAYQLYLVDGDAEGFKARIIHRALSPLTSSQNMTAGDPYCSSATTAQLNWTNSRTSTAGGGFRPATRENSRLRNVNLQNSHLSGLNQYASLPQYHPQSAPTQDRYLPVILELEGKGLLNDEQTSSLLKTLVLEENFEIFRVINSYLAKVITDRELSFRLTRLAQQLSTYIERPQSPLPRKKNQLLQYVNSLARYHFNDPDDIQLLNKLIQEENEFILSCFDVFESDKDHDNLIDSLRRILEKSKMMGLHRNSMTASSFYNSNPWQRPGVIQGNSSFFQQQQQQLYNSQSVPASQSQTNLRYQQPYVSRWDNANVFQSMAGQPHFANQSQIPRSSERPHGAVGGRRQAQQTLNSNNNASQSLRSSAQQINNGQAQSQINQQPPPPHLFQNTTVHNVALIPNYFSSGEEEAAAQQQLRQGRFPGANSIGNSQLKPQNNYHQMDDGDMEDPNCHDENSFSSKPGGAVDNDVEQISRVESKNSQQQNIRKSKHQSRGGRQQQPPQPLSTDSEILEIAAYNNQKHPEIITSGHKQRGIPAQSQKHSTNKKQKHLLYPPKTNKDNREVIEERHAKSTSQKKSVTRNHKKHGRRIQQSESRSSDRQSHSSESDDAYEIKQSKKKSKLSKPSKKHQRPRSRSEGNSEESQSSKEEWKFKRNRTPTSSSHSSRSSSSSSSSDSDSSDSSSNLQNRQQSTSKKYQSSKPSSSKKTNKSKTRGQGKEAKPSLPPPLTQEQLDKVFKREKFQKILSPPTFAMLLYLTFVAKDQNLLSMLGDLYRRETDSEFFITYFQGKSQDALSQLMNNSGKISREEQLRIEQILHGQQESKVQKKIIKQFEKFTDRLLEAKEKLTKASKCQVEVSKAIEKLLQKLKSIAAKSIKKQKKLSTENSERLILGANSTSGGGAGGLRTTQQSNAMQPSQSAEIPSPKVFNPQQIESNFQMFYYGEFLTKLNEEGALVKKLYSDKNEDLLTLLASYQKPSDYEGIKDGIYELIYKMPEYQKMFKGQAKPAATFPPKTVFDAIELLERDNTLTGEEANKLREMNAQGDKRLKSTFETYEILKDYDDLIDSLCLLCGHKKGAQKKDSSAPLPNSKENKQMLSTQAPQNQRVNSTQSSTAAGSKKQTVGPSRAQDYTPVNNQIQNSADLQPRMISLMGMGGLQANDRNTLTPTHIPPYQQPIESNMAGNRKTSYDDDINRVHSAENDENLEINDNPDESGGDTNEEEISCIVEYQHRILTKYTLSGLIRYYDAPFFHKMVAKRDYKMIAIFEVFAVNRNEEDFFENLFIFKELVNEENANEERQKAEELMKIVEQEEEAKYPILKSVNQIKDQLTPDELLWVKETLMSKQPPYNQMIPAIKCYEATGEADDFVHSLKRIYIRSQGQAQKQQ